LFLGILQGEILEMGLHSKNPKSKRFVVFGVLDYYLGVSNFMLMAEISERLKVG